MELTRACKSIIHPDAKRGPGMDEKLILAQPFYNKILEKSIESHKNGKRKASMAQFNRFVKKIIKEDRRYLKLYSQTRCWMEYGIIKAYQNLSIRNKAKRKLQNPYTAAAKQSDDYLHKLTLPVNPGYASFAAEDLHIQNVAKSRRLAAHKTDALRGAVIA